jgi:hypothetical protein
MARVTRPGGRIVVVDTTVPEDDELDRQINRIEWLRDPSHVRNYRESEWKAMLAEAGLKLLFSEIDMYSENGLMDFETWTARQRTSPAAKAELERLFRGASPALRDALEIEIGEQIRFTLPLVTLVARKEGAGPGGAARESAEEN